MTGDFRSKIIDMLQRDTPGVVQSKIAHELKNRNDGPCPIVPKRTTLKQMKYRENKNQRTLRDESATLSICKMSEEPAYIGCIDAVGAKPFFVYYSTPSQKARTKALSKKILQNFLSTRPVVVLSFQLSQKLRNELERKKDAFTMQ